MTTTATPRSFTVEEAERALPLVRRIVADIVETNDQLSRLLPALRRARLRSRRPGPGSPPGDLEALRTEVAQLSGRLEGYLGELGQVGCELHDVAGVVDFPSRVDDAPALLCWRLGEEEIRWWHPPRTAAGDRIPLPASALEAAPACRDGDG